MVQFEDFVCGTQSEPLCIYIYMYIFSGLIKENGRSFKSGVKPNNIQYIVICQTLSYTVKGRMLDDETYCLVC